MNAQSEAIRKKEGPCLILAGAGTGKTHTISEKIRNLLENKVYSPERIVCLTFSNEAANSLTNRIIKVTDKAPIIKTFHSFCADLIKKEPNRQNFRILTPENAKIMLNKYFRIVPEGCHTYIDTIGKAKDIGVSIEDFNEYLDRKKGNDLQKLKDDLNNETSKLIDDVAKDKIDEINQLIKIKKFVDVWKGYEKLKERKGFQDYGDLTLRAIELVKNNSKIKEDYDYFIIDEFQDTSKLQFELVKLLVRNRNITAVGDINQSIYRFRGASKDNLESFRKFFNLTKEDIVNLEVSYRSTDKILKVAHRLIVNNYQNKEDCFECKSHNGRSGDDVEIYELKNSKEEARKVLEIIKGKLEEGIPEKEICAIFRTHQQANLVKRLLEINKIKYKSAVKRSLLDFDDIKRTSLYVRLLSKIKNSESSYDLLWDIFHLSNLDKEDSVNLGVVLKKAKKENLPLEEMFSQIFNQIKNEKSKIKIEIVKNNIEKSKELIKESNETIVKKLIELLNSKEIENDEEDKRFEKFIELVKEHEEIYGNELESLAQYLEIIELLNINLSPPDSDPNGIAIMTGHATKGLEYNTVIVTNMAQRRFPSERIRSSLIPTEIIPEIRDKIINLDETKKKETIEQHEHESQLSEERRLCYVAFTRAKNQLILTYAKDYGGRKYNPSQFLEEIDYLKNQIIKHHIDQEELFEKYNIEESQKNEIVTPKFISFSPSSLRMFDECQKRYEYKYVYNMPDKLEIPWSEIKFGLFLHTVFEIGVREKFRKEEQFIELTKKMLEKEEWEGVEHDEALRLVKVFYNRNKDKISENSVTEQELEIKIGSFLFRGKADRIDFHEEGLNIVDYKTGSSDIKPRYRNWQLGFYAIAASKLGKVRRLTLEMLKKDNSIEFVLDDEGVAYEINSKRTKFILEEIKQELIDTATKIKQSYERGFQACPIEKNCEFCAKWVWKTQ